MTCYNNAKNRKRFSDLSETLAQRAPGFPDRIISPTFFCAALSWRAGSAVALLVQAAAERLEGDKSFLVKVKGAIPKL